MGASQRRPQEEDGGARTKLLPVPAPESVRLACATAPTMHSPEIRTGLTTGLGLVSP